MINIWKDRTKVLKEIRDGRNLSKKRAKYKKLNKCKYCGAYISTEELCENDYICPCGEYFSMPALKRIEDILDEGYEIVNREVHFNNLLDFPDYDRKYLKAHMSTGLNEAVVIARGEILGYRCILFVMEKEFFMGSMGLNTGKIIKSAIEIANSENLPLISFSVSGGARMQEGIFSLMQMANTVNSLSSFLEKNLYISVLTNPTMGGVSASFASLGDIIIAEKGAHIGFSGPRVIEKTLNVELPKGFQSSSSLLKNGFLDDVVDRRELREYLGRLLEYHEVEDEY